MDDAECEGLRRAMRTASDPHHSVSLYNELAPVWDFVIARRYDYDALAAAVTDRAPAGAASVAVLACGPGRLLARLADRYENAVGIDRSARMCELARERTDATVIKTDVLTYEQAERFDVVTLLGNSIIHVAPTELESLFERVRAMLAPDGVFLCDFTRPSTLRNGHVTDDRFESDRFLVERTVITTVENRDTDTPGVPARYTYSFEITEKTDTGTVALNVTDETKRRTVVTGTSMAVRLYEYSHLADVATRAGLVDASSMDIPTPHKGGLLARSPD